MDAQPLLRVEGFIYGTCGGLYGLNVQEKHLASHAPQPPVVESKLKEQEDEEGAVRGYCFGCRAMKKMRELRPGRMSNNKPYMTGQCPDCGTQMRTLGDLAKRRAIQRVGGIQTEEEIRERAVVIGGGDDQ